MNIPRQLIIPIILAISFITLVLATLTFFSSISDYHHYHHLGKLPPFSAAFETLLPFSWLLPILSIGSGILLLRQPERSAITLAWYCAIATILGVLWAGATFVALNLMYVRFHHNL